MTIEAHQSSNAMARCLASYMSDPEQIRREVLLTFLDAPHIDTIRRYRQRHVEHRRADPNDFERSVIASDEAHATAMEAGSAALRDRIDAALMERHKREQAFRDRNDAARLAIKGGARRNDVMAAFGLSATAYDQLAGHVRAGWTGDAT
jgi:hypothetical protein